MAFRREIPENEALRQFGGELLPASLGAATSVAATDPRLSPTELLGTQTEISRERGLLPGEDEFFMVGPGGVIGREQPVGEFVDRPDLSPLEEPDALNEKYGYLGLKFDRPERRRVAEILAKQKQEDLIRQDILARAPGGVGSTAAILGASFLRAAMDPLNIASAFVPVVSQARYAGWLARIGPTGARLGRGTIEGMVGNAMIEPLVAGLSRSQQLDYTMADALVNIGLGGLLGGGLHTIGGRFADAVSRASPEVREAALRVSVAQTVEAKHVNVEPIVRDFSAFDPDRLFPEPRRIPEAREFALGELQGRGPAARFRDYTPIGQQDRKWVEGIAVELRESDPGHRVFLETEGQGNTPEVIGVKATTPEWFQRFNEEARQHQKARKALKRKGREADVPSRQILTRDKVDTVVKKMLAGEPLGKFEGEVAEEIFAAARVLREQNVTDMLAFREGRRQRQEAEISRIAAREIEGESRPENDITADFEAAERISELTEGQSTDIGDTAARAELEFTEETVGAMRAANVLTEEDERVLAEADILLTRAEQYGAAARQAAFCLGRR